MYVKEKFTRFFILMVCVFILVLFSCQDSTVQPSKPSENVTPTAIAKLAIVETPTSALVRESTQTAWPTTTLLPQSSMPTATFQPQASLTADAQVPKVAEDISVSFGGVSFTVPAGLAGSVRSVLEPATPVSADTAYFGQLPAHLVFYFVGYPIADHFYDPRIEIYPADILGRYNKPTFDILQNLKDVIDTENLANSELPLLPMINAVQVLRPKAGFIDFKNGKGYRFLTEYQQAVYQISNDRIVYIYQGLTSDGKYLVAAFLPINAPVLPDNGDNLDVPEGGVPFIDPNAYSPDAAKQYLGDVSEVLENLSASDFKPDLDKLDAMMHSLRIENINGLNPACPSLLRVGFRYYVSLDPPTRNRLRAGPSTSEKVLAELEPGTVVEVLSGPVCFNNLVFWDVLVPSLDLMGWTAEGDMKEQWLSPCPQEGNCPPDWTK